MLPDGSLSPADRDVGTYPGVIGGLRDRIEHGGRTCERLPGNGCSVTGTKKGMWVQASVVSTGYMTVGDQGAAFDKPGWEGKRTEIPRGSVGLKIEADENDTRTLMVACPATIRLCSRRSDACHRQGLAKTPAGHNPGNLPAAGLYPGATLRRTCSPIATYPTRDPRVLRVAATVRRRGEWATREASPKATRKGGGKRTS